jgi:hypothetical protein
MLYPIILAKVFGNQQMSKIIYDVIQRFEVENGVPRLVSTNIQVIQGGEDLLSLAISLLTQMGFYENFEEKRTSQYVGYRLKNPGKGAKRYQLVLAQRKEGLCVSINREVVFPNSLSFIYLTLLEDGEDLIDNFIGQIWVLPSKKNIFLDSLIPQLWEHLPIPEQIVGEIFLNKVEMDSSSTFFVVANSEVIPENEFQINAISDSQSYLILQQDKLFIYADQTCISSKEVLEEFIIHFGKILMEQK